MSLFILGDGRSEVRTPYFLIQILNLEKSPTLISQINDVYALFITTPFPFLGPKKVLLLGGASPYSK